MIVSSISAVMEAAELSPLKPVEKDEGQMAFSALLYEYGANISAGVLVILWCVGVIAPRLIEYFDRKKEEKKKAMEPGAHLLPETAKAA